MKPLKRLKSDFVILFVSLLVSCARVTIKDTEWCGDLGDRGASCFNTLSENRRDIMKEEWERERFGMICTKPETFAEWSANIQKLCRTTKRCTYEQKMILLNFIQNVDDINTKSNQGAPFDI